MNKIGIWKEFEMIQMLFYAFMMIAVSLIIIVGFGIGIKNEVDISQIEKGIAEYRLLNSPDCFIISDNNGLLIRGTINLSKFNEQHLKECFNYPEGKVMGLKLNLKNLNGDILKTIEMNQQLSSQRLVCGHNKIILAILTGSISYMMKMELPKEDF